MIPSLRQQVVEAAIMERSRRREASVEDSLIEMYLAGVSSRRVADITEALWGAGVFRLLGHPLVQDQAYQSAGAHHEGYPAARTVA